MTPREFDKLILAHNLTGAWAKAARRVLVDGETAYAAAKDLGLAATTVSRALKRLRRPICESCGRPK